MKKFTLIIILIVTAASIILPGYKQKVTVISVENPNSYSITQDLFDGDSYATVITQKGDTLKKVIIMKAAIKDPVFEACMVTHMWDSTRIIPD